MMKSVAVSFVLIAAGAGLVRAQDRPIVEERPAVTGPVLPGVAIDQRDRLRAGENRTTVDPDGRGGCNAKTVHKDDLDGSITVKKERCD
jgi:hypothetical protein